MKEGDVMCKEPVNICNMSTNQCGKIPADRVLGMKFMIDLTVFGNEVQPADFFPDK